ncbi:hypothetical protein GCM10023231_19930 [Olivibacter ginsenosidimutans]|uniref:Uncharacterized protein n=1 Tax=Olivibacter ginsenosidimutans TaxID=1176537 RepID=A0ABP9B8J8_9SPHI
MDTITIKIKNREKLDHFLAFIKDLEFVEVLQDNMEGKRLKDNRVKDDFFSLAGLWENRDINADELRAKAWPKKN